MRKEVLNEEDTVHWDVLSSFQYNISMCLVIWATQADRSNSLIIWLEYNSKYKEEMKPL